jgi:hypothetical protein
MIGLRWVIPCDICEIPKWSGLNRVSQLVEFALQKWARSWAVEESAPGAG